MTHDRIQAIKDLADSMQFRYDDLGALQVLNGDLVEFVYDDSCGGVMARAKTQIPKDQVLILMPNHERITFGTVTEHSTKLQQVIQEIGERTDSAVIDVQSLDATLTALIMHVLAKNEDTRFHKVTKTWPTPEELKSTVAWSQNELVGLEGTYANFLIQISKKTEQRLFHEIILPLIKKHKVEDQFFNSSSNQSRFDLFWYAYNISKSRCHEGRGDVSADIIPIIDMFNGMPSWQPEAINLDLHDRTFVSNHRVVQCLKVYASRTIAKGEELIISYGNVAPSACLYKYGFCPPVKEKRDKATMVGMLEPVKLHVPPELAPTSWAAAECLQDMDFPVTPKDIEQNFFIVLFPHELVAWQNPLQGLGQVLRQNAEPKDISTLRQYGMLGHLATPEQVAICKNDPQHRLRGDYSKNAAGKLMLKSIDYTLGKLHNPDMTNEEEYASLKNMDMRTQRRERAKTLCRILTRDTLAQWRHAVCRYYNIKSAADEDQDEGEYGLTFLSSFVKVSQSRCLSGGGCSVCGRTFQTMKCGRCKVVRYCSKEHQAMHWRQHKPVCTKATK